MRKKRYEWPDFEPGTQILATNDNNKSCSLLIATKAGKNCSKQKHRSNASKFNCIAISIIENTNKIFRTSEI